MNRPVAFSRSTPIPLASYDNFLFDCDGVLWRGHDLIPGSPEALAKLRQAGKRIFFLTNNSTTSRENYAKKLIKMGIYATKEEVFSSGYAVALHLKSLPAIEFDIHKQRAFVIGEEGLLAELREAGIGYIWASEQFKSHLNKAQLCALPLDPSVGAVVAGTDDSVGLLRTCVCMYPCVMYVFMCVHVCV